MKSRPKVDDFRGVLTGDHGSDLPMEARHETYAGHTVSQLQPTDLAPGQRWYIETEPDLGIGTIEEVHGRRIEISFHGGSHTRQYSIDTAPLHRVRFDRGDLIETRDNEFLTIEAVKNDGKLIIYTCEGRDIPETEISDRTQPHTPLQMLLSGQPGDCTAFDLRYRAVQALQHINGSPARGFTGAKIDLLPHQMYIADAVSSRYIRRVLLADEVGLGKTIEACLVLHRLMVTGQAQRALILVPESLTHIWFVELLRKFNIVACILDNRHEGLVEHEANEGNPFLQDSCIISSVEFLLSRKLIGNRALEAQWDMLILDEAHHLVAGSDEHAFVTELSRQCRDILFLTATPRQNGTKSHFSRLRVLDPARYTTFEDFERETHEHAKIAALLGDLQAGGDVPEKTITMLKSLVPWCAEDIEALAKNNTDDVKRDQLLSQLLDHLGTGRAFFRNTRARVGGFPGRKAVLKPLEGNPALIAANREEFEFDRNELPMEYDFTGDPRIEYIARLLRGDKDAGFLLICSSTGKVEAIRDALGKHINVNMGTFHEGLSLIQRDRNAAWFAEPDGARILICSEIGSEGRNFQFVNQLIMFDLPDDPELVEQRIGRLDRIGQTRDIVIHVPFIAGSPYEILANWYDKGIGLFQSIVSGAHEVHLHITAQLEALIELQGTGASEWKNGLDTLVADTKKLTGEIQQRMREGRDQLLEMHSMIPHQADEIISAIHAEDASPALERFMMDLFKAQDVFAESIADRTYKLWGSGVDHEIFKGITPSRPMVTFDRVTGLAREDVGLLTIDHPAVHSGIELFLSSTKGRHAFAVLESEQDKELILEAVFVLSCMAKPELKAERFLPPTPIRVVVNHHMHECTDLETNSLLRNDLREWGPLPAVNKPKVRHEILPQMVDTAEMLAQKQSDSLIQEALSKLDSSVGAEITRMETMGDHPTDTIGPELALIKEEYTTLISELRGSRPRLDALRMILKTPLPKPS